MSDPVGSVSRHRRSLGLSVAVSATLYLVVVLLADGDAVVAHVSGLPPSVLVPAAALPSLGFLVRFLRWDLYLRHLGHHLAWRRHLCVYLSGFALTATPGKLGENIRVVFLQEDGVPNPRSVGAFVAERVGDLLGVILLMGLAGGLVGDSLWPFGLAITVTILAILLIGHSGLWSWVGRRSDPASPLGRAAAASARAMGHARSLLTPRLLFPGVAVAALAWGAEGYAFALVVRGMGVELATSTAVGIYTAATLLGALSLIPGGVGPTEATLGGLLVATGAGLPEATAATLLTRAVTLWWAVLVGIGALVALTGVRRSASPRGGS